MHSQTWVKILCFTTSLKLSLLHKVSIDNEIIIIIIITMILIMIITK